MSRTLLALALGLALSSTPAFAKAPAAPGQDISHVNGGISAEAGQHYGDLDTVNGGISLGRGASAGDVQTVNGAITMDDEVRVDSAETVNGGLRAGQRVTVTRDAETVNGGIRFGFNSRVGGDISTVNGGITVQQTEVGGQVHTVSGDITIGARSRVRGGILVEKSHGIGFRWGKKRTPRVVIGPGAVVEGELRFERPVELFVHPSARIGKVTGATAQSWTDQLPARD